VTWHQAHTTAVRRQIRNHGPALLPDGTDPDVGQQTNTDLHRSLLDLRGTRSCAERVLLAFGELRQTNIDLGLAGNARIVANAADPFDTPEQIVIRERINCVNSLAHWQIITESESIKEPRGRSRSQSYSQIALLHSHLFLHDQLTFADISGTDIRARFSLRLSDAEASKNAKRILVAGLECGDLEARRAGEMTAWGGGEAEPPSMPEEFS